MAREIPTPYELAEELLTIKESKVADPRLKTWCNIGLLLYWTANEVNNLVLVLQPGALQDDADSEPGVETDSGQAEASGGDADSGGTGE